MRAALLGAILLAVLVVSALNLVLGGLWVAALFTVALLVRRWGRSVAWLVLLATAAGGVAAGRFDRLHAPTPASYTTDETVWLGRSEAPARRESPKQAVRARVAAVQAEELGETPRELTARAAAVIAGSREVGRLHPRAPAEAAAVDEAVRQLALTLTTPEFRDLEGRRARLIEWLGAVDARLAAAVDPTDVAAAARGLEPAVLARMSLRAVREDLGRAEAALVALVRAGAGAGIVHRATARLDYDEARGELIAEDRHVFGADGPLHITRLDAGALRRRAGEPGVAQTLSYAADGVEGGPWTGGGEIGLGEPGAAEVVVVDRRVTPIRTVPVRTAFRPIAFRRLDLRAPVGRTPGFGVVVTLDGGGPTVRLRVTGASPRLESLSTPPHALHWASRPGIVRSEGGRDVWRPGDATGPVDLHVELVPDTILLRNAAFARLGPYLYTPNPTVGLVCLGLAALAVILTTRRRAPAPVAAADPTATRRS